MQQSTLVLASMDIFIERTPFRVTKVGDAVASKLEAKVKKQVNRFGGNTFVSNYNLKRVPITCSAQSIGVARKQASKQRRANFDATLRFAPTLARFASCTSRSHDTIATHATHRTTSCERKVSLTLETVTPITQPQQRGHRRTRGG